MVFLELFIIRVFEFRLKKAMRKLFMSFFFLLSTGPLMASGSTFADVAEPEAEVFLIKHLNEKNIYRLSVEKQYLDYIIEGKKIFEGRLNVPKFASMKKGDLVYFTDSENEKAVCQITSIGRYDSFYKMLVSAGVINMLPQIDPNTNTSAEMLSKGVEIYSSFPGYREGVKTYGAISIGLHYIGDEDSTLETENHSHK